MTRLVVLASGNGTNLQADPRRLRRRPARRPSRGRRVRTRPDACALQRAAAAGVPAVHVGLACRASRGPTTTPASPTSSPASTPTGRARRLDARAVDELPRLVPAQVVNLHPALPGELPGVDAIERAWHEARAGEPATSTGVMVHLVPDEGIDDGPVLATVDVPIHPDDTLETLRRAMHAAEHDCSSTCSPTLRDPRPRLMLTHGQPMTRSTHDDTPPNVNDEFFDRFEALTFDDVVDRPRLHRGAARHRRHDGHVRRRHHAGRPARLGGDGQGHRGAAWPSPWPAKAASA